MSEPPFDAIVIGSLTPGQLLYFRDERVLEALLEGVPVYLYTPGLPGRQRKNRALQARLNAAQRELKAWGVVFLGRTYPPPPHLCRGGPAAEGAGEKPPAGAVLTPWLGKFWNSHKRGGIAMEIGTVTGSVWATRKARELGGPHPSGGTHRHWKTVAADFVGAGAGDRVLLVCGSTARLYCPESPVDTAIVAILDQMEVDHVST